MKWINIDIEEPEIDKHVLIFDENEKICVGYKSQFGCYNHHPLGDDASGAPLFHVKFWMPLPNQPERLNPEAQCDCIQCKMDRHHQENDPEFYEFQIKRRKTSWCPNDNLLECQKH